MPLTGTPQPELFDGDRTLPVTSIAAGVDSTVIALWLGHESVATTQIYVNSRELHQTGEKPQVA